jgi:1,4-dihydroxy-2-naphthoyl-CoA synthase
MRWRPPASSSDIPDRGAHDRTYISQEGEIATVTISQPSKRNALTVKMWGELKSTFAKTSVNEALRCIVLRGDGDHGMPNSGGGGDRWGLHGRRSGNRLCLRPAYRR